MFTSQALSTLAIAMLSMAPAVQSHMILASPKPFGTPDNSPLDPSGSNYPCKMTSATAGEGPMNDFKVGSTQQLSFSGSAVHGGGSCQISVTTDKNPTKDSVFKVIHSIEGGCPGVGGPATFDFKVPDALPDGELVMAWTWFNHIGNREMYMNCANIQVSGGASDNSKFEKLPDMAIANIGVGKGASCKTAE
ncbi:lytic polysaccharide monooxygenase, partial [Karstenula rhodostoma CBS 690.94]